MERRVQPCFVPTIELSASTHVRYRVKLQRDATVLRPLAKLLELCSIDAEELESIELGSQAEIRQELGKAVPMGCKGTGLGHMA